PHALQPGSGRIGRVTAGFPLYPHESQDDVPLSGHMGKEIEALEHHANVRALAGDHSLREEGAAPVLLAVPDEFSIHENLAVVILVQEADASQQRSLAGPACADQGHHLAASTR